MLTQPEKETVIANLSLPVKTALIAAGAIIVIWKAGVPFSRDSVELFLLISFVNIEIFAAVIVYYRAKKDRLQIAILTLALTPFFMVVFFIMATFLSELFYGGSGYHGEYTFPFLKYL